MTPNTLIETQEQSIIQAVKQAQLTEGQYLAQHPKSQYLGSEINAFLLSLEALGNLTSTVRNPIAYSQKTGIYHNLDLSPMMGTAINLGGLDLRLFLRRWKHIIAHQQNDCYSFQFFDTYGNAIEKVYLTQPEQIPAWQQLCQQFTQSTTPEWEMQPENPATPLNTLTPETIAAYQQEWQTLQNVHHFRVVLSQFGIDRLQGLQYAPQNDAMRLPIAALEAIITQCAQRKITLLTFVNNNGIVQIQTGKVHHITRQDNGLHMQDQQEEQFTCHIQDQSISQFWFVRRPGSNGIVHSFEAYNDQRELVLQLFGRQADAESEPADWQQLVQDILTQFQAA
ncbi:MULTISPECIES: ChuX/HutX family heme-like substrate-binding protein [Kingella]|uniref:ChuX/HutX family heme-like substrate-binding protein n=1 Tax=Kingella TaxID=32257 RepID=UPI00050A0CCF|nr:MULTISPECIES: ChuX/HutX family heme-like substrate-binding protein [Kingella]MDK4575163.1 ChuX/HutX family heme-like substrate-binding protein [Kingella kingae]MDK4607284.1 ChuX/HutX family heme-like substrate-binding protein [Kingella kingae]MDK4611186.1 ChuX/HutX family heme-like substrate-binding protein [Kingella kingae]MDK4625281.1 ChuX/HutX family heme-like substrate-binding protein [Kingella kingae]MDK4660975.1 ChuX/HutX family heme-like substrate-binding protein [Kingella kingae]